MHGARPPARPGKAGHACAPHVASGNGRTARRGTIRRITYAASIGLPPPRNTRDLAWYLLYALNMYYIIYIFFASDPALAYTYGKEASCTRRDAGNNNNRDVLPPG
jgi:hypothetical protein